MATILAVDDDKDLLFLLEPFLQSLGYRVITAGDGWDSLRAVIDKKPSLILMDIQMPKLNGLNSLDLLKGTGISKTTPILLMSSMTDLETAQKALRLGAADFVAKTALLDALPWVLDGQLLSLSFPELRQIVENLKKAERDSALGDTHPHFDVYPVTHGKAQLLVLLPQGLSPADAARLTEIEAHSKLVVLAKGYTQHRTLWPVISTQAIRQAA